MLHEGVTLEIKKTEGQRKEGIPKRGYEPTCFKGFDMAVASLLMRDAVCKWDRLIAGEGCLSVRSLFQTQKP